MVKYERCYRGLGSLAEYTIVVGITDLGFLTLWWTEDVILEINCGVILVVTYRSLGSPSRVYLYGWCNGHWSFDTLVGWGGILEDTWCTFGGILYFGVNTLES